VIVFDSVGKDISYAVRSFGRTPGLTLAVIVSIGLGIAANTVVFSMVNELLIKDMPVRDPAGLSVVSPDKSPTSSYPEYLDFRDQGSAVFDGLAAHTILPVPANISASGVPQRAWGQLVSGNWFSMTGAPLYLGRGVLPIEDEVPGRDAVVVLGYGLWQRLGGDRSIVGKRTVLSGVPYTVAGVTQPGFFGIDRGIAAEFWAPLAMRGHLSPDVVANEASRENRWLEMTGRLRTGVSREQALAALNVIYTRMVAENEKGRKTLPVVLRRAGEMPIFEGEIRLLLKALAIVVGLVLLIACANVANLLLARAASRQQEIGVRLAIGASRGRLVRQLLTESILLAGAGAAFGFLLSVPGTAALARLQPPLPIPMRFDFSPDSRVLLFTTALAVFTGILFGLAPALTGARSLAGKRFRRNRLSRLLVGLQVALSVVLLLGSGLFLRSLQKAASIDSGLKPEGVLMLAIDPKGQGYTPEKSKRFFQELQRRLEATPGVESMSYVDLAPLSLVVNNTEFLDADSGSTVLTRGDRFRVGTHYFRASGITLLRGRDFDPVSDDKASVVIINQAMASQVFGVTNPIGRHIRPLNERQSYEVIGLVRNAKVKTLGEGDRPCAFHYLSDFGRVNSLFGATIMIRTPGDPIRLVPAVRQQVDALDPELPLFNVKTLSRHVGGALLVPRLCGALFGTFGAIGLVLAIVGLYGVVNYSVRTRTREIGIRLALGARPAAIAGMVTWQGLALMGAGLAVGMGVALAVTRFIAGFLYGITPTDAATFAAVPAVMLAVGLVAILLPAGRAARIEPMSALRHE
jgi:predicted permease